MLHRAAEARNAGVVNLLGLKTSMCYKGDHQGELRQREKKIRQRVRAWKEGRRRKREYKYMWHQQNFPRNKL